MSLWGDIRDRVNKESERKEDKANRQQLYEEIWSKFSDNEFRGLYTQDVFAPIIDHQEILDYDQEPVKTFEPIRTVWFDKFDPGKYIL